jgi:hypothetical protein
MRKIKVFVFLSCLFFCWSVFADVSPQTVNSDNSAHSGSYYIGVVLPIYMNWTLYKTENNTFGYTKTYLPRGSNNISDQNIVVSYDSSNSESLSEAMQDVLDTLDKTDCQVSKNTILEKLKNHVTFTVNLDQCANNKSLVQTFKIYSADDGQYSIIYSADSQVIDNETITSVQNAIVQARLVAN